MQLLVISGNVGKDAELRRTGNGDAVLNFTLAVDNGKDANGTQRPATWYGCAVWGKRGEALEGHIVKGGKLSLSGRPTARAHEGKAYLGITVDNLTFMGGGKDRDPAPERSRASQAAHLAQAPAMDDGDVIPF